MTSIKLQAVAGVTAVLLLSKILGLVREMVIAAQFGTSANYDLFLIGVIVPALLSGVLSFASYYWLVPYFSRVGQSSDDGSLWKAMWSMLSLTAMVGIILTALVGLGAPWFMRIWAANIGPIDYELTVFFCRLTSGIILLAALESLLRAILQVRGKMVSPALGLIVFNVVSIALMVLLSGSVGATAIGIGMIGGFVAQVIWLVIRLMSMGAAKKFSPGLPFPNPEGIVQATGLLVLIELISRSYFMIDRYFAPQYGDGLVAALNYSSVLALLPDAVVGVSIASIVFPVFSRSSQDNKIAFAESFGRSIIAGLTLAVPMMVVAIFAAPEIVYLAFKRGAFTERSVQLTASTFLPLTPVIVSTIVATLSLRACYAFGWYTPVLITTTVLLALKWVLTLLLAGWSNGTGIAAATAISQVCYAAVLGVIVFRRVPEVRQSGLGVHLVRVIGAGLVAISVLTATDRTIENVCAGDMSFSHAVTRLVLTAVVVGGIFVCAALLFGLGPMLRSFFRSTHKPQDVAA